MKRLLSQLCFLFFSLNISASELGKPDLSSKEFWEELLRTNVPLSEREPDLDEFENVLLTEIGPMVDESPDLARSMIEGMLDKDSPSSASFNFILANLYFTSGLIDQAIYQYERAIEKYPSFRRAWKNLGMLYTHTEDFEKGLEALLRGIELGEASPETFGTVAHCHIKQGNFLASELAYNYAITFEPLNPIWLEGKTLSFLQRDQYENALPLIKDLIRLHPDEQRYHLLIANAYHFSGKPLEAARAIEVARMVAEINPDTLLQLATIYANHGMFDLAMENFQKTTVLAQTDSPKPILKAIQFMVEKGEHEHGQTLFDTIGKPQPSWDTEDHSMFTLVQAGLSMAAGRIEEAETLLIDAFRKAPLNSDVLLKLGLYYEKTEAPNKALHYFSLAEDRKDIEYQALIFGARVLISQQKLEAATAKLSRAYEIEQTSELKVLLERAQQAARR